MLLFKINCSKNKLCCNFSWVRSLFFIIQLDHYVCSPDHPDALTHQNNVSALIHSCNVMFKLMDISSAKA